MNHARIVRFLMGGEARHHTYKYDEIAKALGLDDSETKTMLEELAEADLVEFFLFDGMRFYYGKDEPLQTWNE